MRRKYITVPNIISLGMIFLVVLFIYLFSRGTQTVKFLSILLIPTTFFMDWLDGYVARKYGEETSFGSFVDVVTDRFVEVTMLLYFFSISLIPIWIPLYFIIRGFITDLIRLKATRNGISVYGMMKSGVGKFIVKSRIMRGISGGSKIILFILLPLLYLHHTPKLFLITYIWLSLTILVNFIRAIPVIYDAKKMKII
ncbi:MAG: CDP-alcohol phosphatidyltransferase family protein [Candidatus Aenigmarchaeota archaeon]|nr:CDP-alcohol phosphatidyltransferase family protein [Candidatus Aenigmarchaeota archaeon]